MMCRRMPPTAGKPAFSTRTRKPSAPRAGEFRILSSTVARVSMSIGDTVKPQAPTRGRRRRSRTRRNGSAPHWIAEAAPVYLSAYRPPHSVYSARQSAGRGPLSLIRSSMLSRVSRRMADRTARFRSRYTAVFRPPSRRAARRLDMRSPVAAEIGGASGFRTRTYSPHGRMVVEHRRKYR